MKASFAKIATWVKAHRGESAAIGTVGAAGGYLVWKKRASATTSTSGVASNAGGIEPVKDPNDGAANTEDVQTINTPSSSTSSSTTVGTGTHFRSAPDDADFSSPVVTAAAATGGGELLLSKDGRIHPEGGAKFYGDYRNLPSDQQISKSGNFVAILPDSENGGYSEIDSAGHLWSFGPDRKVG